MFQTRAVSLDPSRKLKSVRLGGSGLAGVVLSAAKTSGEAAE